MAETQTGPKPSHIHFISILLECFNAHSEDQEPSRTDKPRSMSPILKANLTRLCQVKIRAKTFHTSALSTAAKNSKATERKMLPAVHKEPLQHNINLRTLI